MSKIRDILIHVSAENTKRQRQCKRKKARKILKDEGCLVVKTGSMGSPQSYCRENAKPMLDNAWYKLQKIYDFLDLQPPPG